MWIKRFLCAVIMGLGIISGVTHGDDTELYVFESSARSGAKPQVLIIFDNSGSMRTMQDTEAFYDPDINYLGVGNNNSLQERMLYFTKGGNDHSAMPVPNSPSESRRFLDEINGCESSLRYLNDYGVFTGFFREYTYTGQNGTWQEIPNNNGANITIIDCFDDIEGGKWGNASGQPNGFPVDSVGNKKDPIRYTEVDNDSTGSEIDAAIEKAELTEFGTGQIITLYTDNYLHWFHGDKKIKSVSRLEVAKEVIKNTIVTTNSVDFGLAIFNYNYRYEGDRDGGRIVSGIKTMTDGNKIDLLSIINNLTASTYTPLCETLYEAYLYFAGKKVDYGNNDRNYSNRYKANIPARDIDIEDRGTYLSPFKECQNRAYVVYITDGRPSLDHSADSHVRGLAGVSSSDKFVNSNPRFTSYLPALAGWMNNNDVNTNEAFPGKQSVTTFTIGFSDGADNAVSLLTETADLGGGEYYSAKSATELQAALSQVFSQILEVNASFTSPSVASNHFDRTRTFDFVYYAMFLPNTGPRWMGNLKKFKVSSDGNIVDKNGVLAIASDGNLKSSACSYWTSNSVCSSSSDGGDGNDVRTGGIAHVLRTGGNRTLYGNLGSGGGLEAFTKSNASNAAGGDDALASYMKTDVDQLAKLFDWAKGIDVDDDNGDKSVVDKREDIIGDPLHSKPLAINFGTSSSPDIRVIMGTNHGFLHMFKDTGADVTESWAFMPYELLPNIIELRANVPTGVHSVYGMDSSPVSYVKTGIDGIEKAWLFVGMRRGGKSYYALDITNPDSPSYMWKIDSESAGMSELGQTWSEPVVTLIPGWPVGNTDADSASAVLIFGAGYSPLTKDAATVGIDDTEARGVFIVDAKTGVLVHSFGPTSETSVTQMPEITDSIPNSVAVLDANGDGLTDRIYATDTGGNVWRMDLPSVSPKDSTNPWTVFKFADLGGVDLTTDRRFFAEPTVAQTIFTNLSEVEVTVNGESTVTKTYQNVAYDAVVVGTGHRPHPSDLTRSDMFYMLQDRNVISRSFNGEAGNEVPKALTLSNLYNVTSSTPSSDDENIAFGLKRGWYYRFDSVGEKSLAGAAIIEGKVYFTSYVPGDISSTNQCLIAGEGRFYGLGLHKGTRTYTQEYFEMGDKIPDTPQLVIATNNDGESYKYLIGIGAAGEHMEKVDDSCSADDDKCVGEGLGVNRIYYHINE